MKIRSQRLVSFTLILRNDSSCSNALLLLPLPGLAATDHGYANVPVHFQFLPAFQRSKRDAINLAVLWIENLPVSPRSSILFCSPQNRHAFDRLIFPLAFAPSTKRVRPLRGFKHLQDFSAELAVLLGDSHNGLRPPRFIINRFPCSHGRIVASECAHQTEPKKCCADYPLHQKNLPQVSAARRRM